MRKWWAGKNNTQKLGWVAGTAGIIFLLFWIPVTRSIILFILPLGSGFDDLVFLVAAILFGVFGLWRLFAKD